MEYEINNDQRSQPRVSIDLPVVISVGSQLTVKGQLKDISLNSAFIKIKNNIYLTINDEIGLAIQCSAEATDVIQGMVRISRIIPGEGFAVYFTSLNDDSMKCLKKVLQKSGMSLA